MYKTLYLAMAGTSATLLARRWESALLVNVDNDTLRRLLASPEAMEALMHIEGFRSLNQDISLILNKSEHVKKAKKEKEGKLSKKEKEELTAEEKEFKSKRKMIQEKLIKFATRVPIFMYLSEYRERSLKDVITLLEPELFNKVTGLTVKDFELLCSLGVFNSSLMDDAVYKFKRYEDSSLEYTGLNKHEGEDIGGFETTMTREEYEQLFYNQQAAMDSQNAYSPVAQLQRATGMAMDDAHEPSADNELSTQDTPYAAIQVGTTVKHKTFGKGTVVKLSSKHMTVKFKQGTKKFIFPGAFQDGFLTL